MKRTINILACVGVLGCAALACAQAGGDKASADEQDKALKHWQWMFELRLPEKIDTPFVAVNLTPEVFGKARIEQFAKEGSEMPDLRLTDAKGTRIPFVVRAMRERFQPINLPIARFNAAPNLKNRTYEASYELGNPNQPFEHNEIEILTTRRANFRRKVEVFGDDNGRFDNPKSILGKNKYLVYYDVDGKIVDVHKFRYDLMRYRFLLVRVYADDPSVDEEIPAITSVKVRQMIEIPGESVTEQARLDMQQQTRGDGGPGTAWFIVLPDRMPCDKLTFEVAGDPSERPMRLEIAEQNQAPFPVNIVEKNWRRAEPRVGVPVMPLDDKRQDFGETRNLLEVRINEVVARRLRFVVTDFANEPLRLNGVKATYWVRKLIFEKPDEAKYTLPLRLYAGNKDISRPGYDDLEKKVSQQPQPLTPAPALGTLDKVQENPTFEPPAKTVTERWPWLVYVVLGFASAVLLAILLALVKQAITRHDAAEQTASSAPTV